MAITETNLPGNGTAGPFTYTFPALEAGDIYVSVDGVVKTVTTDYSLNFVDKQITFLTTPYPTVSNVIRIYRVTDDADLAATFYSGAAIRATDLNTNFTQGLYVTQESNREAATAISTAGGAVTTANAATATANSAVSTANAATATANTALSNSSAAVSTANTASSNASAAVSTANTASSNASAAVSTANTASSNATNAVNTANAATATANSAASDAATAISTANGAVTTANNAAADAATAISTANTASSNASAAVSTANTASSNATSAVNTANSALSTANAAASAVANAILYDIVANVAAIPASPANNDAVEVIDSTGIESFTPLTGIPGGFAGNSGLSVRIVYTTTGNTWTWIQYFPNDPETRYLKEAGDTMTGALGVTTGTAAAPSVFISGDTNTGIYSPGADQVAVATNGVGRLFVDDQGRVGVGAAAVAGVNFNVQGSTPILRVTGASATNPTFQLSAAGITSWSQVVDASNSAFYISKDGTERLRITSAGLVGIGTSSPSVSLHVVGGGMFASSTTGGSIVQARNSDFSSLGYFGVEGSTGGVTLTGTLANSTFISSGASGTPLQFGTGGVIRSTLTSTGLGIGTTSPPPGALLAVNGQPWVLNQNALLFMNADNTLGCYINGSGAGGVNPDMVFSTSYNERARIDSSGRLLVGTSSGYNTAEGFTPLLQIASTGAGSSFSIARYSTTAAHEPRLAFKKSASNTLNTNTLVSSTDTLGGVTFEGFGNTGWRVAADIGAFVDGGTPSDSSMPGRLVFSTTADGASFPTERMRISSTGVVTIQNGAVAVIDTLTDAATITPNFAEACNFTVTLGGNRTIANPTNLTAGQSGSIFLVQDATGSRALSWGSYWDFAGGTAPTLSSLPNAVDRVDYIVRSSTSIHTVFTANYS
jgi:hypothetical protein